MLFIKNLKVIKIKIKMKVIKIINNKLSKSSKESKKEIL